jgi:hypothetical protein
MEAQSVKSLQSDYLKADITDKYIDLNKKAMFYNERIPTKGVKHADVINFNILLSEICISD